MRVGVMGAGAIGCYVGGCLQASGVEVRLVGRPAVGAELGRHGLRLSDARGGDWRLPAASIAYSETAAPLADCDVVLVAVKGLATAATARELRRHVGEQALVVSLQNGVRNPAILRAELPGRTVLGAMVPFNVLRLEHGRFHRGTSGTVVVEACSGREQPLVEALAAAGIPTVIDPAIDEILWGKLLLNLNNPINALAGVPLRDELLERRYRIVLAACIDEGLATLARAGIAPRSPVPLPLPLVPRLLRLPTPLFRLAARSMIRIDRQARSSMWDDLERRRPTEIDLLNGEIVALASGLGSSAPVNEAIVDAIRAAERAASGSPGLAAEALLRRLRLAG